MTRSKKAVEETNLKEIPLEDLALEEIEELPAMPEIQVQEPSVEENGNWGIRKKESGFGNGNI